VGYFGISFKDFAQPLQAPLEQRWAARHRLQRANPADPASPITRPIVYYIDPGIPEPVRTATREGALFWTQAFDEAGLKGAFRVEELPAGADALDARYNVVQWINRNERGWSVGGSLGDPRTGEIIKGMARMDSHRARTDYNLYAGLMGADAAAADTAFILARIRQVTAHEIGHTLGLAHNYIASGFERASVMDYPPPRVRLDAAGNIDLREAYGRGPGPYDVWAVRWGYGIFPAASEADSLRALVAEGLRQNFLFLSDADARPEYAADPRVNLWDDAPPRPSSSGTSRTCGAWRCRASGSATSAPASRWRCCRSGSPRCTSCTASRSTRSPRRWAGWSTPTRCAGTGCRPPARCRPRRSAWRSPGSPARSRPASSRSPTRCSPCSPRARSATSRRWSCSAAAPAPPSTSWARRAPSRR
jgi:hypothetical protein